MASLRVRPEFLISGGQTGADSIALSVWERLREAQPTWGIGLRGYMPRGCLRSDGEGHAILQRYGLWEGEGGHKWRDCANAGMSDVLVAFLSSAPMTGRGTMSTVNVFLNGRHDFVPLAKPEDCDFAIFGVSALGSSGDAAEKQAHWAPSPDMQQGVSMASIVASTDRAEGACLVEDCLAASLGEELATPMQSRMVKVAANSGADGRRFIRCGRRSSRRGDEPAAVQDIGPPGRAEAKPRKAEEHCEVAFPYSASNPKHPVVRAKKSKAISFAQRPVLVFWDICAERLDLFASVLGKFLQDNKPQTLMVSGPLETTLPGVESLGAELLLKAFGFCTDGASRAA